MKSDGTLAAIEKKWLSQTRERARPEVTGRERRRGLAAERPRAGAARPFAARCAGARLLVSTRRDGRRARCARGRARSRRRAGRRVKATFFSWPDAKASFPSIWHAFWTYNVKLFLIGEVLILVLGAAGRRGPAVDGTGAAAAADRRGGLHRPLPRHPHDPAGLHAGASACRPCGLQGVTNVPVLLGAGGAGAVLRRLRRRGDPRRHRVDPPLPDRQRRRARAVPRPGDALRRRAAGHPPRGPAAAQRLRLPAEGHRPGRRGRASSTRCSRRRTTPTTTSTSRPTSSSPATSSC